MKNLITICATVGLVIVLTSPVQALLISPNYDSFSGTELDVLKEAVKEWADLLPCSDGKTVPVEFLCDPNLSSLGLANVWFKANGDVDHAEVTLDNDGLHWDLTDPAFWTHGTNEWYDALSVAKHEVGHAIGFIHGGNFTNKVREVDGNRFYDMNGDGVFNDNDFDLQDGADWDGHAASTADVMYRSFFIFERRLPSLTDAQVLGDAYGYCVVPEPATLTLTLLGLGGLMLFRRGRRS